MKPYTEGISSLFKNERADQNFFEYKIVNHSSELGLTIEEVDKSSPSPVIAAKAYCIQ